MTTSFTKFPSTPHLVSLSASHLRHDKVMAPSEAAAFLSGSVGVEEKVDGANIGFSFDTKGNLLIQNRGGLISRDSDGQFSVLNHWLQSREEAMLDVLEDQFILFGEWCYAQHSIHYTRLPDYFLVFDLFDKKSHCFKTMHIRNAMADRIGLFTVPHIRSGNFDIDEILGLISESFLYDGPMEGIYLRRENEDHLLGRAKIVRAEFVQQIAQHWSKRGIVPNNLRTINR